MALNYWSVFKTMPKTCKPLATHSDWNYTFGKICKGIFINHANSSCWTEILCHILEPKIQKDGSLQTPIKKTWNCISKSGTFIFSTNLLTASMNHKLIIKNTHKITLFLNWNYTWCGIVNRRHFFLLQTQKCTNLKIFEKIDHYQYTWYGTAW